MFWAGVYKGHQAWLSPASFSSIVEGHHDCLQSRRCLQHSSGYRVSLTLSHVRLSSPHC